jgi:KUP system potassium uptake protein
VYIGLEALYADLGHFGRGPIRLSWLSLAFPALVLNYMGQGALLLSDPSKVTDPFFYSVPQPLYWPMFVLSILATLIASQAMITGAFSLLSQAVNLNYFPSVTVRHTSAQVYGQVYIPEINFFLLGLCIIIVVAFQRSEQIGNAYGLTVCTDMTLTTILYTCQMRFYRKYPWPFVLLFFVIFFPYDIILLASNTLKIVNGGWVSLLFAFYFFSIMLIWYFGERRLRKALESIQQNIPIDSLLHEQPDHKLIRTPGMGIFLTPIQHRIPKAFTNFVSRIHVVPEVIVFLTIKFEKSPFIEQQNAVQVKRYGDSLYRVIARLIYIYI